MMISVIIPALNEEQTIGKCIAWIKEDHASTELIVADGGSIDRTRDIISDYPDVALVKSEKGRGMQMNSGAAKARGDILLFLHADTRLASGWYKAIETMLLSNTNTVGGAFTFKVDHSARRYRILETMVRLRCRLFRLPYGDQAIFIRREAFEKISGYTAIPLMEDVKLVSEMKKLGNIMILDHSAYTDSRRWERKGIIKTSVSNLLTLLMYKLGVSPNKLAERYYR
jgi:rSAM/selenodomain-associated transferase 2